MDCKYCGYKMAGSNRACSNSPINKCVGLSDGTNCVYCTYKFVTGASCLGSPTGKHQLDT